MAPQRGRIHWVVILLLAVAALSGGCVYLRLLALRNQLADFDRNFTLDLADGVRIQCHHPLIQSSDLRWLGVAPTRITTTGRAATRWRVRWLKQPPPGVVEPVEYDVELFAELADDRVTSVHIAERSFEFFPKELFAQLLRSTASARVDRRSRRAEVTTVAPQPAPGFIPPRREAIEQILGLPTDRSDEGSQARYLYRYLPDTTNGEGRPVDMTFVFDQADGALLRLSGRLPRGTIDYTFAPAPPAR